MITGLIHYELIKRYDGPKSILNTIRGHKIANIITPSTSTQVNFSETNNLV